jgi:membrane-associated protease RseP (regulator of RpoE activity)
MEDKPRKSRVWIVILVLGAMAGCCMAGVLAGGLAGWLVGRNSALRAGNDTEWSLPDGWERVEPQAVPEVPLAPELDTLTAGALITGVVAGSPAEQAGLQTGDLIVALDGVSLGADAELADLILQHEPGDRVELSIAPLNDPTERVRVEVVLGRNPDNGGESAWLGIEYFSLNAIQERFIQPDPNGR